MGVREEYPAQTEPGAGNHSPLSIGKVCFERLWSLSHIVQLTIPYSPQLNHSHREDSGLGALTSPCTFPFLSVPAENVPIFFP